MLLKTLRLTCLFLATFVYSETLDEFLKKRGHSGLEGHIYSAGKEQPEYFKNLLKKSVKIRKIAEVGFNAGHSSELFLEERGDILVTSFDIMKHKYSFSAKEYIDKKYPKRHSLIKGDSKVSIPEYSKSHIDKFDLIYIDGWHFGDHAWHEIINLKKHAHQDTVLVIDDVNYQGAYEAWKKAVKEKVITHGKYYLYKGKQWMECRYIFNSEGKK